MNASLPVVGKCHRDFTVCQRCQMHWLECCMCFRYFTSARTQRTQHMHTRKQTRSNIYKINTQSQPLACLYNHMQTEALRYALVYRERETEKNQRNRRYLIYFAWKYMGKTTHGCDANHQHKRTPLIVSHSVSHSLSFQCSCGSNGHSTHTHRGPKPKRTVNAVDKYYRILPKPFVEKYAVTWAERSVWF